MLVKTHVSVGIATALLIQPPTTAPMLGAAIAVSAVSGAICDIDSSRSKAKRGFDKLIGILFVTTLLISGADYFLKVGIRDFLFSNDGIAKIICAVFMVILICFYGGGQPHRGFMHSLACCFMMTVVITWIAPSISIYFCTAFMSHIMIDLLNKKGEQLFWPLKWKGCLNICKSDGATNTVLLLIGIAGSIYAIYACPFIQSVINTHFPKLF